MTPLRLMLGGLALGAGLLIANPSLVAADNVAAPAAEVIYPRGSTPAPQGSNKPASGGSASFGLLVTAAALAAGGGWLFWRGRRVNGAGMPARHLSIAETKSLGNRQYLVVASYQDKKFLLGVCPGRIDLLTALDAPTEARKS